MPERQSMGWIGLILGGLIGASFAGFRGSVVGAAIGLVLGEILRRVWPPGTATDVSLIDRLARVEQRLAMLEANLAVGSGISEPEHAAGGPATTAPVVPVAPPSSSPQTGAEASAASSRPLPVRKGGTGVPRSTPSALPPIAPAPSAPNPLWSWFTGGHAMVRVGVVVLFFGVAFLLAYFAEHFTVPIGAKFAGVGLIGAAMIGTGARLRFERRAYAMALIGGGLGVLYLTTFAALEIVALLPPAMAFALLAGIAALAAVLALRFDSQALAALAALGGLLAPALVETDASVPLLFGYVAVVNAMVLAIAWHRSWRLLNLVGFVFTFVLSLWWGFQYYRPEHLSSVEPFLILFFAVYVAVPIANALFAPGSSDRRLDATLVFGVPVVAFALQATLLREIAHGLAWTAAAVALLYASLWITLRRRAHHEIRSLAASHGALALAFATLAVPLAVDPHWTSAIWAVEAVALYWIACREGSGLARAFALLIELGSGIAFILGGAGEFSEPVFLNRQFLGIAAIALSGFATAAFADRHGPRLLAAEHSLVALVFAWACAWWFAGGALEVSRHVEARSEAHAMLAWIVGSVAVAVALAGPLRWPRLDRAGLVLLPALAIAIAHDLWRRHTSMPVFGWALYPVAWGLHFVVLDHAERRTGETSGAVAAPETGRLQRLSAAHALGMLLLLGQLAWEAGEWTARVTPLGTAWAACAHLLPLAAYLYAIGFAGTRARWPAQRFHEAYAGVVGTITAAALGVGFGALAILHPGDTSPLPYLPVLNPLEITLIVALGAIVAWTRTRPGLATIPGWVAVGAFVILNGAVIRAVHHWLDVPWRFAALAASKPLQAALTLTWSAAALTLMITGHRRGLRPLWLAGAGLLAAAVIKLFVVDLAALAGLTRVVAFLGVGVLLLVIGYVTPLPPTAASGETSDTDAGPSDAAPGSTLP